MRLTDLAIENDRTTMVFVLLLILSGLYSYWQIPRSEDPGFTIRTAVVTTLFPGASVERVERLVTDEVERVAKEIPQLRQVRSESRSGISMVWVEVQGSYSDMRPIWDHLRRKMEDLEPKLPEGAIGPDVDDEFGDVFGIILTLRGEDYGYARLDDMACDFRESLLKLEQSAKVEILGRRRERIFIEYDNARMSEMGVSPAMLGSILKRRNVLLPGGYLDLGSERVVLEPSGNYESIDELRDTIVNIPGRTGMLRLGDLAEVKFAYQDPPKNILRSSGEKSLALAVSLREGGDVIELGKQVRRAVEREEERLPWGVELDSVAFQPDRVRRKVGSFIDTFLQAVALSLLVMMAIMGPRSGLIVATLLPATVLGTLALMYFLGIGLDQVSIAALIIALGMLVDSAIVMVEAIAVQMGHCESVKEAALRASTELFTPLLTSALTTSAAFLPIYLAESATGEYTASLFEVVTITLLLSWLLTLSMIPLFCVKFRQRSREGSRSHERWAYLLYRRCLQGLLSRPLLSMSIVLMLFAAAIWSFRHLPVIFFPPREAHFFIAEFTLPAGTSIEKTSETVKKVEDFLEKELKVSAKRDRGVENWVSFIGCSAPRFVLNFAPPLARPEYAMILFNTTDWQVIDELIVELESHCLKSFPGIEVSAERVENGPPIEAPVELKISGTEIDELFEIVHRLKDRLRASDGVRNVRDDWGNRTKKIELRIEQSVARRAGVSNHDVAMALRGAYHGVKVTEYRERDEVIPVIFRAKQSERGDLESLEGVGIFPRKGGDPVELARVADLDLNFQPSVIKRLRRKRTITVRADLLSGFTASEILMEIVDWLEKEKRGWPRAYDYEVGGEVEESRRANEAIFVELPFAAIIIVLLLVTQFNSIRSTAIVLCTIPLAIIGVAAGLHLMSSHFGFMTLLGLISLAGIVLNNAIVLLKRISSEISKGELSSREALLNACMSRVRPVLLTAVTTIGGLVPLYLGGGAMWQPMTITLISGLAFSTLLTLGVVPVLYALAFEFFCKV